MLAWPALFLSLGWDFWEYGLDPPNDEGGAFGLIVCGVVFVAMGLIPLIATLVSAPARRSLLWADATPASGRSTYREAKSTAKSIDWRRLGTTVTDDTADYTNDDIGGDSADVVDRLQRVSALYRRGDITADEYAAGKRMLFGEHR